MALSAYPNALPLLSNAPGRRRRRPCSSSFRSGGLNATSRRGRPPASVSGYDGAFHLPDDPLVFSAPDVGDASRRALGLHNPRPLLGIGFDGDVFAGHLAHLRDLPDAALGKGLAWTAIDVPGARRIRNYSGDAGRALFLQSAPSASGKSKALMPFVLGLNHRTAPVSLREKLAIAPHLLLGTAPAPQRRIQDGRAGLPVHLQPDGNLRRRRKTGASRVKPCGTP